MRLSSQRSSSTLNTGTLVAARDSPLFSRRIASSRPRLWGIETTSGADIQNPPMSQLHVIARGSKGRGTRIIALQKTELSYSPAVAPPKADKQAPSRAEERSYVYRHHHPDYPRHRAARRL